MRRLKNLILTAAVGLSSMGCATVLTGTPTDTVTIASDPTGAECRIERMSETIAWVKATPESVKLPRSSHPIDVFCSKDGQAGAKIVDPGTSGWAYPSMIMILPYVLDSYLDADRVLPETVMVRFPVKP